MEVLREQEDLVKLQQLVKHVEQDVRFARVSGSTNQHPENISGHGGVLLPIAAGG